MPQLQCNNASNRQSYTSHNHILLIQWVSMSQILLYMIIQGFGVTIDCSHWAPVDVFRGFTASFCTICVLHFVTSESEPFALSRLRLYINVPALLSTEDKARLSIYIYMCVCVCETRMKTWNFLSTCDSYWFFVLPSLYLPIYPMCQIKSQNMWFL